MCPKEHFTTSRLTHITDLSGGIFFQAIELNGVIKNGTELIVKRFKVHGRVFLTVLITPLNHFILPSNHISRLNIADFALTEVRQDLRADNMLFGLPSVFFNAILHIHRIGFNKARKGHTEICLSLVQKLTFPSKCFTFGRETSFLALLSAAFPIGNTVHNSPSICFFILIDSHLHHFLSLLAVPP